ncbi:MAG: prolipoprotein diacylglyceryl transferase [Clostridia bacterium]|nr:prolipoprotein diacylglyceryl transferase [Clostridia bacterium]
MFLLNLAHYIEFPNIGWRFPLNDTMFQIGSFTIKWYGVLIALGYLLAVLYGLKNAHRFDIDPDKMIDVALVTTIVAFIGARLYYVLFSSNLSEYLENPVTILHVWNGGLAIYGGIIVAFLFGPLMCRIKKVNTLAMCDIASLGFLIGQSVGRWGNFFNQEAFGDNTNLPWAMTGDIIASGVNGTGYTIDQPVHPTFLYESLWCILGFVLLHLLSKHAYKFKGMLFCGYAVWYGTGRFLIESLRTDSLRIGLLRVSQLVAVAAVIGGTILFFILRRRSMSLPMTLEETLAAPLPALDPEEEDDSAEEDAPAEEEVPTVEKEDETHGDEN